MSLKIDLKDRKILYELDKNARVPFSTIGKVIGLSESVVRYRVQRMQEAGIIKGFMTFIDTKKLGFHFHNTFIKFKVMDESKQVDLIEKLKNIPSVAWLASTETTYDLIISVLARDIQHYQELFAQVLEVLEGNVAEDSVFLVSDGMQFPYPVLPDQPSHTALDKHAHVGDGEKMQLRANDLRILEELALNARITTLELAQKLDMSMNAVAERFHKLLDSDLVQGFKPLIDMSKLGKNWHVMLLQLKYITPDAKKQFVNTLKSIPETFFIVNGVGNWHMQLEFYTDDKSEFRSILTKIFPSQNSDIVKKHTEMRITQEHKCVFYPVGIGNISGQTKLDVWCTTHETKIRQKELEEAYDT